MNQGTLDLKAVIPLHFLPKKGSEGKWHDGLMKDSKKYIGKCLQVLVFHEMTVYLELDNLNRRGHILTSGVRFLDLLPECPKSKGCSRSSKGRKGKAVCVSGAPGEPWQPPTPSPAWTKQCIQTTRRKMVEKDEVGHDRWKRPKYVERFILKGKCPPGEQSLW